MRVRPRRLADSISILMVVAMVLAASSGCASSGRERLPSLGVAELAGDTQVARLKLDSHYFEPSRLRVQVGVPVRLVLENDSLITGHNFSLFAPDANLEINAYVPARQRVTVQFLPEKAGDFSFYCNIDDHAEKGMTGTLEVVEGGVGGSPVSRR